MLWLSNMEFCEWRKDGGVTLLIRRTRSLSEVATLHSQSELEPLRPLRVRSSFMVAPNRVFVTPMNDLRHDLGRMTQQVIPPVRRK
jgi:tRNA1(Val) A37 N6-methylase TrmN6